MANLSNVNYAFPTKANLSPGTPTSGVIQLTTTVQTVLSPPATEAPRWVTSGARIVNVTETTRQVTLYYVPNGSTAGTANIMAIYEILGKDTILIGEFPLMTGFTVQAAVDATNNSVNIFLPYEEIE